MDRVRLMNPLRKEKAFPAKHAKLHLIFLCFVADITLLRQSSLRSQGLYYGGVGCRRVLHFFFACFLAHAFLFRRISALSLIAGPGHWLRLS